MNKKIYFLSFAQIVAMLLIVLSHSQPDNMPLPLFVDTLRPILQMPGLVVFIFVSAYLAVRTNSLAKYGYAGYLKRRLVRLLLPYVAVSVLMIVPKYLLRAFANSEVSLNALYLLKQLVVPRDGILPHLWFLPTLFILSALLPLWIKISKNKYASLGIFAVLLALQFTGDATDFLCINDLRLYALWFFLGVVCAGYVIRSKKEGLSQRQLLGANVLSGLLTVFCIVLMAKGYTPYLFYKLVSMIFILSISMAAAPYSKRFCDLFGPYTFPIYIMSLPIQNILNIIFARLGFAVSAVWTIEFIGGLLLPYAIARAVRAIEKRSKLKPLSKMIGM